MARYGFDPETGRLNVNPDFWKPPERDRYGRPSMGPATPDWMKPPEERRVSLPEWAAERMPTSASRDWARAGLHGLGRTGNMILKFIDIPNRVFGNTRSVLQDVYEKSEANMARDAYEDRSGAPQVAETAVHLASAGVFGRALPAVFGANVGADTYETAKYAGESESETVSRGVAHGIADTMIWTFGRGLASKYLPKAWQWLGRELTGAMRGATSSVTSDAMLNSMGADISGDEMAKRAVHAAWMVPLLGMLKMGKGSRERALAELKKVRPDLAGERVDKVIETLENEFSDPRSQKVALAWVARKGANLPDDLAQIHQAIEVANKVKGVDFTQKSPFEIISDPRYARYLPKPRPQDVEAFSNMKRYPMGVIGFDVSDDAAGRQATREMINAYMSPSSNPWCLATGKDAAKLGELGPGAEGYWKGHSAVPKQIFFQEVDGKLELTAFRATSSGGEGRQEYWDTSDAGYSGIPLKVKVPGDPMGRYRKMVFRPDDRNTVTYRESESGRMRALTLRDARQVAQGESPYRDYMSPADVDFVTSEVRRRDAAPKNEVQGTFEDIAPGKVFKGDPFRDGHSQTWSYVGSDKVPFRVSIGGRTSSFSSIQAAERELVRLQNEPPPSTYGMSLSEMDAEARRRDQEISELEQAIQSAKTNESRLDKYYLTEDKERTTENGITKFRTTKYADPTDWDYEPPKPGEQPKPVEIEESELVSPEWMHARGYDPESESDVRRMQSDLNIQAWGNGREAAMAVVPTKRTYMQTKSGTPETVTYGPNGRDVVSVDFEKDGVPYREEYFHSGPAGLYVPEILGDRVVLDIRGLPTPSRNYLDINEPNGFRLVRNPGGESPEVLDEIKWDDGLGGFVRTSGNRRWRVGDDPALDPEGKTLWAQYQEARHTQANDFMASSQERLNNRFRLGETKITWESWAREHGVSTGDPTLRLLVEDHQPDGTWSVASTADDLPPAKIPFAAKAGRTRRDVQVASKAGDADRFALSRNFLASDETPDTLFGIPVVADKGSWTERDIEFFRKHPEAGGYYDMGNEEGAPVEPPMQAASKAGTATEMSEEDRVAHVNAGIAKHPGFSKGDIEDMRKSAAFIADPKNAIRGLLVEGTLKHDAERPVFYSQNDWEGGQRGFQGDRFSMASSLDDGRVVVFPSIYADKDGVTRLHTGKDAFDHYQKTGEHFGIYDSVENANRAAEWSHHAGNAGWLKRHEKQQDNNGGNAKRKIPPIVKGPLHYGPPPPPSRGKYPGIANNPGNVEKHERRSDKTLFKGEIAGGVRPKRFANFSDPVDGLTAAATVLSRRAAGLAAKGLPFTIENYVPGYAPKSENDVEGYIGNLSRYSGFARDAVLDTGNAEDMAKLLKNVVRFESGVPNSEWFTDDEYRRAALAMQEGASGR